MLYLTCLFNWVNTRLNTWLNTQLLVVDTIGEHQEMNTDDIRNDLSQLIELYEQIKNCHDCNDCGNRNCPHRPKLGETVRINCFAWESIEK